MSDSSLTSSLSESVERWSRVALNSGWAEDWVEGAIFPREMVYFIARCESAGVRCILESGRQDGYSTLILGQFASETGVKIISLDMEDEVERSRIAREKLAAFPVECVKGNAFIDTDRIVLENRNTPMALLFDGPKGFSAMAVMFSAARHDHVRVIAEHNLDRGMNERAVFERLSSGKIAYEDESLEASPSWRLLGDAERSSATRSGARRSVEASSLCVTTVDGTNRDRMAHVLDPSFGLFQPLFVTTGWQLGLRSTVNQLFSTTFRLQSWLSRLTGGA